MFLLSATENCRDGFCSPEIGNVHFFLFMTMCLLEHTYIKNDISEDITAILEEYISRMCSECSKKLKEHIDACNSFTFVKPSKR